MMKEFKDKIPKNLRVYDWKGMTKDDISIVEEMISTGKTDGDKNAPVGGRIGQILNMIGEQAENNSLVGIAEDGSAVAAVIVFIPPGDESDTALTEGMVRTSYRGRGIGSFIFEWATQRAREELKNRNPSNEIKIRTSCEGRERDRMVFFESKGLNKVRYSYKMRRDIGDDIIKRRIPEDFRLVQWSEELDGKIMNAFNEAFKDQWGTKKMDADSWRGVFTGVEQFRSDLSFALLEGDSVAGFCINWVSNNEPEPAGWVEAIGVIPKWRGMGIASLLMDYGLFLFKKEGFKSVGLDVDAENPTGALKLYEKHKFRIIRETIIFEKEIITN